MPRTSKSKPDTNDDNDVFTYRRLRRAIGILGFLLPLVLILLSLIPFFKTSLQPSISHFYYTNLREIFTGILCAVGLFMIRYKGHGNKQWWKNDNLLTNISGSMALGIAFIPANPLKGAEKGISLIPYDAEWLGQIHYVFAAILFLGFAVLAICVFTIGQKQDTSLPVSIINENNIYRFCGWAIIVFISAIFLSRWVELFRYSTLVFEALSLLCFGIAWLIKGRALGDKGEIGKTLYRETH